CSWRRRGEGVPGSQKTRRKMMGGLISMGGGVVGVFKKLVLMYARVWAVPHPPIQPVKSSVASSSEGSGVSWPILLAITWSMVVPALTFSAIVRNGTDPLNHAATVTAWPSRGSQSSEITVTDFRYGSRDFRIGVNSKSGPTF